jgi:transposase InsO family protein
LTLQTGHIIDALSGGAVCLKLKSEMPWNEKSGLDQRKLFVTACNTGENSVAELCRQYGISRQAAYKWLKRFAESGESGLEEKSRAPHCQFQEMLEEVAEEILGMRREHPRWGPKKLKALLERKGPEIQWPAVSTIGALLKREGLTVVRRKRMRTPGYSDPLAHADAANRVWCADFKGWFRCGDGARCDPLTCSDAFSRYLLRVRSVAKADGPHVKAVFDAVFQEYGLPDAMRTDNGPPFASKAPGGLTKLSMWWLRLGIRHERIAPGCPEQNGRHERMHQTLKQETASPPRANLRQQQEAFIAFEREYNYERPHEALDNRTPAELYERSVQTYPARLPELEYPCGVLLRRISQQGSLKWKCERTFISEVLAREVVGLLEVEDGQYDVYYGSLLIGRFDVGRQRFHAAARVAPGPGGGREHFGAAASTTP